MTYDKDMLAKVTLGDFFIALAIKETSSVDEMDYTIGDLGMRERARGEFQITKPYWEDAGVTEDYATCFMFSRIQKKVMLCYWMRYCPSALMRHDWEVLARVHNGGPKGHLRKSTTKYWNDVYVLLLRVLKSRLEENSEK